jgi:hypothetical protein
MGIWDCAERRELEEEIVECAKKRREREMERMRML